MSNYNAKNESIRTRAPVSERDLVCGKVRISQCTLYFFNKASNTEKKRDTSVATIGVGPVFVSGLLDQCESKAKLTWHNGNNQLKSGCKVEVTMGVTVSKLLCKLQIWTVQIRRKTLSWSAWWNARTA